MFPVGGHSVTAADGARDARVTSSSMTADEPGARTDCRHYSTRTVGAGEVVQRCRLDAATLTPFACPEGCLFLEPRVVSGPNWR